MKKLILFFTLAGALFSAQISQNVSNVNLAYNAGEIFGQSFTATGNENLVSIDIAWNTATVGGVDLRIYNGQTSCGVGAPTGGAINTTLALNTTDTNPNGAGEPDLSALYTTMTLSTPLAMTNGNQYTFCFQNVSAGIIDIANNNADPYAGGQAYSINAFFPAEDLGFRVNVSSSGGTTTAHAPLSKNALILLFLGFLTIGMYGLRSQKA